MSTKSLLPSSSYRKVIRGLNHMHYAAETDYYGSAELRPSERSLIEMTRRSSSILDLGCGAGRITNQIRKPDARIVGLDINHNCTMAGAANAQNDSINFVTADMTKLPIRSSSFTDVWCLGFSFNSLPTLRDRVSLLREMKRVCAPDGRVFVQSFNALYGGKFGAMWIANALDFASRRLRRLAGSPAPRLYGGDHIYLASKAEEAAPGYAHFPTQYELERLARSAWGNNFTISSRPDGKPIRINPSIDYSIWLRLNAE
jgi:ubiquinone/menaquinone biosynthesis C-methylase UbiE